MATAPTTTQINDVIIAQLEAAFNQTIPLLPKSFLRVIAKVLAGVIVILYKYAGFMFLQMFVQSATIDETEINGQTISPLKQWGNLIGVGNPTDPTNAALNLEVAVTNQTGILPSGSQLLGPDNGIVYVTTAAVNLNAATVNVPILAAGDQNGGNGSGAIGNLDIGAKVNFANPLPNINSEATVISIITTAADGETAAAYRQRIIDRFQKLPQGGAYADYEGWGEEVEGIINVYPYTSACPGQVDVYVEATEASSGSADGIPTDAQLQSVLDSIELDDNGLASRRPAGALVNAFPISRLQFDTTVAGLIVDDLAAVQASINEGVAEFMLDREPFIPGLSVPPRKDRVTRSAVGGLVEDIVSAANGIFSSVILKVVGPSLPDSSYSGNSFSVAGQEVAPQSLTWSADGSKFFVMGNGAIVYEYTCSPAFDLSGAVAYTGNSFSVAGQEAAPKSVKFNDTGFKMYVVGDGAEVFEYSLDSSYDLSGTVAYTGSSFDVSSQEAMPWGLAWSEDGTKFFITGDTDKVYEYTVSVGFALSSTVAYSGNSIDISLQEPDPKSVRFYDRGYKMAVVGDTGKVHEYDLKVAYGFGTAVTYNGLNYDVSAQDTIPVTVEFDPDRSKFWIMGQANDTIYEYNVGEGSTGIDVYTLGEGEKAKSGNVSYT